MRRVRPAGRTQSSPNEPPAEKEVYRMNAPRHRLLVSLALGVSFALGGCAGTATSPQPVLPATSNGIAPAAKRAKQILYVLVNVGNYGSYVALYDAFGKNAQPIGKITQGIHNPGAIWVDPKGNVYVGNDMTYTSSVTEYAPGGTKPTRTYTNGIDLPFGGTAATDGTLYVSVAGIKHYLEGGIAVFPRRKKTPSAFLTRNIYVPHGEALDPSGNLFVAVIFGDQSSVVEFPAGSSQSTQLPLNDLDSGAFLEDLKLDAANDIVVADANLNAVRFYPPPYKDESMALTKGLNAPTGLSFGHDGSLFVGNEYVSPDRGNVVVFPPGATKPARTIVNGITGGVLGVAIGPSN
jgi:hypothetical protein